MQPLPSCLGALAVGLLAACSSDHGRGPVDGAVATGGAANAGAPSSGGKIDQAGGHTASTGGRGAGGGGAGGGGAGGPPGAGGGMATDAAVPDGRAPAVDTSLDDGPSAQAFDLRAGRLNVDYAGYLSKHDVVYGAPNTVPAHGLTVGNGKVGAMVFGQSGLTMQVSGVDASEQGAFSAGLVTLHTTPAMDAGYSVTEQRLSLYDSTLTTKYDSDRTVTLFGSPRSEVMGIHVHDGRSGVSAVALDVGIWDVSTLGNSGDVPNLDTWKTVALSSDSAAAGLSRGQKDPNDFGYSLAATVDGTPFTATALDATHMRLNITPATDYTVWFVCASRFNAPNHDSVTEARRALAASKADGYDKTLAAGRAFWHSFWQSSFVQYANGPGDADYLENVYYLATYLVASGGYGSHPFHFINGVYRATGDDTKWSNAYWYWNQRDVYASFLASNHADVMSAFNGLYSGNAAVLQAYTKTRYGIDGIWVPETMGWDGNARGTVGSDFTKNIYSTGTEAAENMYAQYEYTGDAAYLANTAYPFMKGALNFYEGKLTHDTGTGQYYMASSNAHETYWNVKDAITDLAAVRSLVPITVKSATSLGVDAALVPAWQDMADRLAPYPTDGNVYLPHDPPTVMSSNGENVAAELIWPYNVTGIAAPDYDRALATWKARPFPYGNVWANDAIQAARLGLGEDAYQGMRTMLEKYQSYPNGFTNNTNGVFEYLGVHLSVMNESLLQSYNDKLRVFPGAPGDAGFVGRFTLLARGGFLVTSELEGGDVKYVGLKSQNGGTATLVSPWSGKQVRVTNAGTGTTTLTSSAAELAIPTAPGGVYVVERVDKPLAGYAYARLTGAPRKGARHLSGTACSLGISAAPPDGGS